MSSPTVKHVIRMGPITVLALVIVLSLATMAVLSLATANAAASMVDKQQDAQQALYDNERMAQEFVADLDATLSGLRDSGMSAQDALAQIAGQLDDAEVQGSTVRKSFVAGSRTLTVTLAVDEELRYSIEEWKTQASLDSQEDTSLWMG